MVLLVMPRQCHLISKGLFINNMLGGDRQVDQHDGFKTTPEGNLK